MVKGDRGCMMVQIYRILLCFFFYKASPKDRNGSHQILVINPLILFDFEFFSLPFSPFLPFDDDDDSYSDITPILRSGRPTREKTHVGLYATRKNPLFKGYKKKDLGPLLLLPFIGVGGVNKNLCPGVVCGGGFFASPWNVSIVDTQLFVTITLKKLNRGHSSGFDRWGGGG